MKLSEICPEDLINPNWLDEYNKSINVVWRKLVRLNSNLLILSKIISFPFKLFDVNPPQFWRLVENALFDSCVLLIWQTCVDTDPQVLTIRKLKNQIFEHAINEKLSLLGKEFKQKAFDEKVTAFEEKVKDIRDNYVAHLNSERHLQFTQDNLKDDKTILDELKSYTDIINEYFQFLCFSNYFSLLPWDYSSETNKSLDIDNILSTIARDSYILNAPETNQPLWKDIKDELSQSDIETLNQFREMFNLPKI